MTGFNSNGVEIEAENLSRHNKTGNDHNAVFNHDGSSSIPLVDGTSTSKAGLYLYNDQQDAFRPVALVPLESNVDETANRTAATWYQNTSDRPLILSVQVSGGAGVDATLDINTTNANNAYADSVVPDDGTTASEITTLQGIVPPGDYYQVRVATGSVAKWSEHELGY